jgi:steroid 5-alpha reductase family enzyme
VGADLAWSIGAAALTAALVMGVTALVARRQGRVAVVDVAWGSGFVLVAVVCALVALLRDAGDPLRTIFLAALVAVWGSRLAWHIHRRTAGHTDEDPRYEKVLGGSLSQVGMGRAVRKVFAVQGTALTVIALPVAVGVAGETRWWALVVLGGVLWVVGLVFESVGDAQLAAYRAQPRESRPQVLDTGLWRWTRHPNYFGDACVWWGVWLAGGLATGWVAGLATVVAPIAMTYFLVFATGARLIEKTMMERPGYREYAARTSFFVPRPPRRA